MESGIKKVKKYNPIITHDVDRYYKWKNSKAIFGEIYRIFGSKSTWSYNEAWKSFKNRGVSDPFANLIQIAELDNLAGLSSVFYIMTTEEKHPLNINDYSVNEEGVKDTLIELAALGSEVGIHPGILTYNDVERMRVQKERLEDVIEQKVTRSRQHYLKYEYPGTFEILDSIGIENDSSILVDLAKEEEEKRTTYIMFEEGGQRITQTPLVFMDTHHMQSRNDDILKTLEASIAPAKKEGGEIMILWHNNNISNNREIGLYKEALDVIKA